MLFAVAIAHAGQAPQSERKDPAFLAAQATIIEANRLDASVLAPATYQRGAKPYQAAQVLFEKDGATDRVVELLAEAAQQFTMAAAAATVARGELEGAYQARLDAERAGAQTNSAELWRDGEDAFRQAASRLERGRRGQVDRYADEAESLYRQAELASIEAGVFAEIDRQIATARKLDAEDYAPQSYRNAVELVAQARSELAQNRYDTDRPRNRAKLALHHARHAQYVSRVAAAGDDTTLETVLLEWEAELGRLGALVDQPLYFDDGPGNAVAELTTAVEAIQRELADREVRISILEDELSYVRGELAGQAEAKARLDARLALQERREHRIQRIEALFGSEEAQVLRAADRLVIRLIGLAFSSGSAALEPRHEPLLVKLFAALGEFPETPVVIEGHTDSFGMDSANLSLSVARADAVAGHLLANTPISPAQLTALGYGEARPIANNETAEGRARNRRIDVVVYPQW